MPSHNSKYYTKSLKTNTVKSHNIAMLFKRKINESSDGEPSSKLSTNINQNQDSSESISDNDSGSIHVSTLKSQMPKFLKTIQSVKFQL